MFNIEEPMAGAFNDELENLIKQGNDEEVQSIFVNQAINNFQDHKGSLNLLHLAAKCNNIKLIKRFIQSGCELDVEDSCGMTPLTDAVMHGNFEAAGIIHEAHINVLVGQLTKPDASNDEIFEIRKQVRDRLRDDIISLVINKKFSSDRIGRLLANLGASLIDVVSFHDADMTESYLECAVVDTLDHEDVMTLVIPRFQLKHIQVLLSRGSGWEGRSFEFFRILLSNIRNYRKSSKGRKFLEKVFSWENFGEEHFEYLEKALMVAKKKCVKVFLQYDVHVIAKAIYGRDVLACLFGNCNADVRSLLDSKAIDINGRGYEDRTPLHFAIQNKLINNLQLLLDRGADPDPLDQNQCTPLEIAMIKFKDERLTKVLLLGGANPLCIKDKRFTDPYISPCPMFWYCDYQDDLFKTIIAHFVICDTLELLIDKPLEAYLYLSDNRELNSFMKECYEQLNELKNCKIREDCECNMFNVLIKSPEVILRYVSDEDVRTMIATITKNDKNTLNSYYLEALKKRADDITRIKICKDKAINVIGECIGMQDSHHVIVEKIVNYLDFRDLLKFELHE